jgi:inhibitor of KinA
MVGEPRFLVAGEAALVVEFGDTIDPEVNRRVRALLLAVDRAGLDGIRDLVPSYRSLLVSYDPLRTTFAALRERLAALEAHVADRPVPPPRVVEIPTAYGGAFGPDLPFVAGHNGLTEDEVVAIHAGTDYLVYMMGFSPGFTYLGGMSERIAAPRLETPRTAIPAGSVGIAQQQTGIYPVESPGGWRLIGRTPVPLFDPSRIPPVVVDAGDHLRFVPVTADEYSGIRDGIRLGTWTPRVRDITREDHRSR